MKSSLISAAVAAAIVAWSPSGFTRETIALPGVVGGEGVANGVDTTGAGILTIGTQNINTNNDAGGAIKQAPASAADVRFGGNATVTGDVGTAPSPIFNINGGATASIVTFNGTLFATTLNVSGTGSVVFNGNTTAATNFAADGFINLGAGRTLIGAMTTVAANTGTLTLNAGSSVIGAIGGATGIKQINLVGGNAAVTGAVQALGFNLGANTLAIAGSLTTNFGASIATTLASNAVFGNINPTGASNINAGGITVVPTVAGVLTNGTNFRIVNGLAGPLAVPVTVVNNNPRYTFTGVPTTTGDVNIKLTGVAPLAALVNAPGAAAVAPVLDASAPAGSDLLAVQNVIAPLATAAAINNALAQLAPGTSNLAAPRVAAQSARLFDDLWMARVDEIQDLCCDACEPGKPVANLNSHKCKAPEQRSNWWAKAVGSDARQGDLDNANGYRTRAAGLMLAYDVPVNPQTRAGVGLGYAGSTINGNNDTGRTKVDSYQVTGYVSYKPGPWFVQGALTAGTDRYDGSRSIGFATINRTANADYRGRQLSAVVNAGRHFEFGGNVVTPLASLQATRLHVAGYTETGAGDINLRINNQDYNFLQSSLGVKAERVVQADGATFSPEVHVKWLHDFNSTTMRQDAMFTGGGPSFTAVGVRQDSNLFNVGAGLTVLSCNCAGNTWSVKGLYDYKWTRSDYASHQLSLLASLKF